MKKLVVLSICLFYVLASHALDFTVGKLKYTVNADSVSVMVAHTEPYEIEGDFVIPDSVMFEEKMYAVTSIGNYAFNSNYYLTSLTIPKGITSIGAYAFISCIRLREFVVAEDNPVVTAQDGVLFSKSKDTIISYPNKGADDYVIPSYVKVIGNSAFYNCYNLRSVVLPEGLTIISESAFNICTNLASVAIPDGVTFIGANSFKNCDAITSVVVPESVTSIGTSAFSSCDKLVSATFPSKVTTIGKNVLFGCAEFRILICRNAVPPLIDSLEFETSHLYPILFVPDSAGTAYSNAPGWRNFSTILEEGDSIGYNVTLEQAGTLLDSIKEENLKKVYKLTISGPLNGIDLEVIQKRLPILRILDMGNATLNSGQRVPDKLPYNMFDGRKYLKSVTLPSNITSIGENAFRNCDDLTSVKMPEGLSEIENFAFQNCHALSSVSFPSTLNVIGFYAFQNCMGLSSLVIPEGVINIVNNSFKDCGGLKSISIPSSVTSIWEEAFIGCCELKSIRSDNSVPPAIRESSFFYVNKDSCIVYVPAGSKAAYMAADQWKDFKNIVEMGVTEQPELNTLPLTLFAEGDGILVKGVKEGETISVYSSTGVLLQSLTANGDEQRITLSKGAIYIVKAGNQIVKLAL